MPRSLDNPPTRKPHGLRFPDLVSVCWLWTCCTFAGCSDPGPGQPQPQTEQQSSPNLNSVPVSFQESKTYRSLKFNYDSGASAGKNTILESLGGGIALLDYDLDGRLDVCAPQGGQIRGETTHGLPTQLARQTIDGGFESVSDKAGIGEAKHYSHGLCVDDWDNDGFPDLIVTGHGGVTLWVNQGDGTFLDRTTPAQLTDQSWSSSAAAGDLNGDGYSDLYLCRYVNWSFANHPRCNGPAGQPDVCPPRVFEGLPDTVYFNRGDGTFEDATESCRLSPGGKGLGVVFVDIDNDHDLDIYVSNDTTDNFLYVNNGTGQFAETGLISGAALDHMAAPNGSMGIAASDFNHDGFVDLFVTNYENELIALYRNSGQGSFLHVSNQAELNQLGTLYVGFGCVSEDFDLDGDSDYVCSNGHVIHHPRNAPVKQRPLFLELTAELNLQEATPSGSDYFLETHLGRGVVAGDLNRDGCPDLVFSHVLEPSRMLLNQVKSPSRKLTVTLVGTSTSRFATGTRLALQSNSRNQFRQRYGGGSYLSSGPQEIYFAIPANEEFGQLTITWPDGTEQTVAEGDIAFDREGYGRLTVVQSATGAPASFVNQLH